MKKPTPKLTYNSKNNKFIVNRKLENTIFGFFHKEPKSGNEEDIFFETAKTKKELEKKIEKHLLGDTPCEDFETEIILVIKNGKECNFSIKVSLT